MNNDIINLFTISLAVVTAFTLFIGKLLGLTKNLKDIKSFWKTDRETYENSIYRITENQIEILKTFGNHYMLELPKRLDNLTIQVNDLEIKFNSINEKLDLLVSLNKK
jgi:t-SNARE complex subunit (syntaxin)